MKKLCCLAVLALFAGACSSAARNACAKRHECCANMSVCEEINAEGPGWLDRCEIDQQAELQKLGTFGNGFCEDIAARYAELLDCLGSIQCADLEGGSNGGHVAKCDPQARAWCQARRTSGDACGHDWGQLGCDGARAELNLVR